MKAETVRETIETASEKEKAMIDRAAGEAKDVVEQVEETKLAALDKVVTAVREVTKTAGAKTNAVSDAMSKKAADVTELVGMKASDMGAKAGELKARTTKRAQDMPWLAPMVAVVLLLVLALSVGKRLRASDSFDI